MPAPQWWAWSPLMRRFKNNLQATKVGQALPPANFSSIWTRRLRLVFAALALAVLALAQTASEKPSLDVRRVGMRLQCQCGCKDSVATCSMLECGFTKPAKEKIARMLALGMTDQQIIDDFVRENGPG